MSLPGGSQTPCQPGVKASGCSRLLLPRPAGMLAAFPPRDQVLGLHGEHRWCPKVGFIPRALGEPVPSWAEGLLDHAAGNVFSWCASAVPNGANSFVFFGHLMWIRRCGRKGEGLLPPTGPVPHLCRVWAEAEGGLNQTVWS